MVGGPSNEKPMLIELNAGKDYNRIWLPLGLPSCKIGTVHLLCYFGTAILEIIASDMQLQIKLASSSSIFRQHVVHTTLWYK